MRKRGVGYWAVVVVACLAAAMLLLSSSARDRVIDLVGDDARESLVALYGDLTARKTRTADLTPIAHAGVNPYAINVFLEQEVEEWKIRRTLEMVRDAGFRWIKQQARWFDIETPAKGQYFDAKNNVPDTWQKYDRIVDLAREYGLDVVLRLDTSPQWARPGNPKEETPPDRFEDFGDYVAAMVARYQGRVKYYQIWNEPNLAFEWGGGQPNAQEYVRLLRIAYTRAKAADPDSVIIAAALAPTLEISARATNDLVFLQQMYDAGASQWYDVLGANAYGLHASPDDRRLVEDSDVNFSRPILIREMMVRNGDAGKPIWAGEMGWNALPLDFAGEGLWGRVSREQQARYTVRAYQRMQEEWPWMPFAALWHFRMVHEVNSDKPQYYFGIVDNDFAPQPAYEAMKQLASVPPAVYPGFHQEAQWALRFEGDWQLRQDGRAVLGAAAIARAPGDSLRFAFFGSDLDVVAATDAYSGRLLVSVDGGANAANRLARDQSGRAYVDLWSASELWQQRIPVSRGLPWGRHEVEMRVAAGPEGAAGATLDGIVVAGRPPNVARSLAGMLAMALVLIACFALAAARAKTSRAVGRAVALAGTVADLATRRLEPARVGAVKMWQPVLIAAGRLAWHDDVVERSLLARPLSLACAIGGVLLLAWWLRLYRLGDQSLWYDEGTSAALAGRTIATITRDAAGDIHPPLYYYVLHFWSELTGTGEFALRFLSVVWGLLAISLVYKLGRRLLGRQVGLIGTLFAAASPFLIYYAQEARMYTQVTALAALSMYLFIRLAVDGQGARSRVIWVAYLASTAAMLYSHYFAVTIVLAQNIFFLGQWLVRRGGVPEPGEKEGGDAPSWRGWLGGQALLGMLFLPWVAVAFGQLAGWPSISPAFGLGTLLHRVFLVFSFGVGWDSSFTPRREMALLLVLVVAPIYWLVRPRPHGPRRGAFILLYAATPVLAMYLLSLQRPMYNPKFLLPATPPFQIALAAGAVALAGLAGLILAGRLGPHRKVLVNLGALAVLLGAIAVSLYPTTAALGAYYFDPKYARDDYRGLAQYIATNGGAGDSIVLNAPGQSEIFDYYYKGSLPRYPLPRQRPIDEAATAADLGTIASTHRGVWVVLWALHESDPHRFVEGWLDQRATKELDRPFGSVRLLYYRL